MLDEEQRRRPVLIVISGAPVSGKTCLAKRLSGSLRIPVIHKDELKETLFDTLGIGDREWSRKLGGASWELLFRIIDGQIAAGRSIIAEANFYPSGFERIRELRDRYSARVVVVNCTVASEVLLSRYTVRSQSGDRHAGHVVDSSEVARLDDLLRRGFFDPAGLDTEVIAVDTTDFSRVDCEAITVRIRSSILQP